MDRSLLAATSRPSSHAAGRHIAIFLPSFAAGGVGRSYVDLANGFHARGARVDFAVGRARGPHRDSLDPGVQVVELGTASRLETRRAIARAHPGPTRELLLPALLPLKDAPSYRSLPALASYLQRERPEVLLSGKSHANLTALWARELAGTGTRVVVSERSHSSEQIGRKRQWRWRYLAPLIARMYPRADAITAVSDGVADDLAATAQIDRTRVRTIYNPIPTDRIRARAQEPPGHPWLDDPGLRVILGVGRLVPQKGFPTLLDAFARLAGGKTADAGLRLVILGEGQNRAALERQARRLGLEDRIAMPGYAANPYAAMARARVFALSSTWEGLPGVLLEALACGCPVVATDCPSGPREILEGGRYGELVPRADALALADAIERALADPPPPEALVARAEMFGADKAIDRYLRVLL